MGKVGRGLEDSETLFALICISKYDVRNRQYHDLKHFVYFFSRAETEIRTGAWIDLYLKELNILQSRKNVTKSWQEKEEIREYKH